MPGSGYKGVFLRIQTDSLEAIKQLCDSLGGKIVREPVKQDYGKTEMWLEDPEGNLIQAYKDR
jgi:predicted enzyme related to lactoylglutathione lyase